MQEPKQPEILWGAAEIARVVDQPVRKVFYMLESGLLPAKKVGKRWQSTRSALLKTLNPEKGEAA